jgi:CRP/FNR family cyclic AMP-dependent transcriptional regulator
MKERFQGAGCGLLIDTLMKQDFVGHDRAFAEALAGKGTLVEFAKADKLIEQGQESTDVFLLLAGSVAIVVNGNQIATRRAGDHVGEMAAINPEETRSATVVALQTVVTLKLDGPVFHEIGESHPRIWKPVAQTIARRLYDRNRHIPKPNAAPKLFVISSTEAIALAENIRTQLDPVVFSRVWKDGVFFAGGYTLEALEQAVAESDFAIAIAQADDIIESRGGRQPTLRDNVLFELGLFMGQLTRARALLVHPRIKDLKLPSDLQGLTLLPYDDGDATTLTARLAPVCDEIRKIVEKLGVRLFIDDAAPKTKS